nr:adenine deaminase C-terminal domain-containing protein [Bacillus coahuilensis]
MERHHATGNIGLSNVKGAIATTIAHDSHNIVVAGTNDEDMLTAISELERMQGGLVYIVDGAVKSSLSLPIAGLFSNEPFEDVKEKLVHLKSALLTEGFDPGFNPFLTLSFLTLPVIPQLKLTDKGLFDVDRFEHITIDF